MQVPDWLALQRCDENAGHDVWCAVWEAWSAPAAPLTWTGCAHTCLLLAALLACRRVRWRWRFTGHAAVAQVRAQIRKVFTNMGFQEMPSNAFVESRRAPSPAETQKRLGMLLPWALGMAVV